MAERDGVRVLEVNRRAENVLQFFVSTRPETSPSDIVRSLKGRLQHLWRENLPKTFRRNYCIQSVGESKSSVLDAYVGNQLAKHPMADDAVHARLEAMQYFDPAVDLSLPLIGTYGKFLNSLQVVVENWDDWNETRADALQRTQKMIVSAASKKHWQLSRIGLLSNHIHILLGGSVTESPQSIALSLMNNIAYVYEITPVLKFSYYVGTFGRYDRGVLRVGQHAAGPAGQSPTEAKRPDLR